MSVSKRATTTEKKKAIMKRFYRLWLRNPELRFSQLIENVYHHSVPEDHCIYHIEDEDFLDKLEEHYEVANTRLPN